MADREYGPAADEYLAMAELAEERGAPQAARLFIAAGMAVVEGGELDGGTEHLLHGLDLLERDAPAQRLSQAISRISATLRSHGHDSVADRIEAYASEHGVALAATEQPAPPAELPTKCPQCGGTVHPAEVVWIDSESAECGYCGSVLRREGS